MCWSDQNPEFNAGRRGFPLETDAESFLTMECRRTSCRTIVLRFPPLFGGNLYKSVSDPRDFKRSLDWTITRRRSSLGFWIMSTLRMKDYPQFPSPLPDYHFALGLLQHALREDGVEIIVSCVFFFFIIDTFDLQ